MRSHQPVLVLLPHIPRPVLVPWIQHLRPHELCRVDVPPARQTHGVHQTPRQYPRGGKMECRDDAQLTVPGPVDLRVTRVARPFCDEGLEVLVSLGFLRCFSPVGCS